jgi:quercetin dioxygenase-like cupin family protein
MGAHHTRSAIDANEDSAGAVFRREGLTPSAWSNAAGDVYARHEHAYHKVLFCIRGSITFALGETGEEIEMSAGDRLDIEPGTTHSAVVGPAGVTCMEAARR